MSERKQSNFKQNAFREKTNGDATVCSPQNDTHLHLALPVPPRPGPQYLPLHLLLVLPAGRVQVVQVSLLEAQEPECGRLEFGRAEAGGEVGDLFLCERVRATVVHSARL